MRLTALLTLLLLSLQLSGCGDSDLFGTAEPPPERLEIKGVAYSGSDPILKLDADHRPTVKPAFQQVKRDFYECAGVVSVWFQMLALAEMNHLARLYEMEELHSPVCMLTMDKQLGHGEGKYKIHFYKDRTDLRECEMNMRCRLARNMSLVVWDRAIYRSYFLTDFERGQFYQHCMTPDNVLHRMTTCYLVNRQPPPQ
jgi:hypothetical protein